MTIKGGINLHYIFYSLFLLSSNQIFTYVPKNLYFSMVFSEVQHSLNLHEKDYRFFCGSCDGVYQWKLLALWALLLWQVEVYFYLLLLGDAVLKNDRDSRRRG